MIPNLYVVRKVIMYLHRGQVHRGQVHKFMRWCCHPKQTCVTRAALTRCLTLLFLSRAPSKTLKIRRRHTPTSFLKYIYFARIQNKDDIVNPWCTCALHSDIRISILGIEKPFKHSTRENKWTFFKGCDIDKFKSSVPASFKLVRTECAE